MRTTVLIAILASAPVGALPRLARAKAGSSTPEAGAAAALRVAGWPVRGAVRGWTDRGPNGGPTRRYEATLRDGTQLSFARSPSAPGGIAVLAARSPAPDVDHPGVDAGDYTSVRLRSSQVRGRYGVGSHVGPFTTLDGKPLGPMIAHYQLPNTWLETDMVFAQPKPYGAGMLPAEHIAEILGDTVKITLRERQVPTKQEVAIHPAEGGGSYFRTEHLTRSDARFEAKLPGKVHSAVVREADEGPELHVVFKQGRGGASRLVHRRYEIVSTPSGAALGELLQPDRSVTSPAKVHKEPAAR